MAKSRKRPVVSAQISSQLCNIIDARAKDLKVTRSKYISLILQAWYDNNCQPVDNIEAAVMEQHAKYNKEDQE